MLAIGILAVNDHLLKGVVPGLVTGKLSDAAGLLVAPPLLAVLVDPLRHRRLVRTCRVGRWSSV
jgi:hypothetical protein